jgi:hypothetical protein
MSENIIGRTERGFGKFGEWPAMWHGQIRVQESSAAFKGACVWIFCERSYGNAPEKKPPHLHLQYQDAVQLRDALNRFLAATKDGETVEPKESGPDIIS